MKLSFFSLLMLFFAASAFSTEHTVQSPDKKITVTIVLVAGKPYYKISRDKESVIQQSKLGIIREDADFSTGLSLISVSSVSPVVDTYQLLTIKRKINTYKANKRVFHFKDATGKLMDVIFQVSNDGTAFRYHFPENSGDIKKIQEELTSYKFSTNSKAWLQPMADAKSGWAKANPSYEEFYEQGMGVGKRSPIKAGWIYPALFQTGNNWVLISETFPQGDYCGTRLKAESPDGEYTIGFPQAEEVMPGGALKPESKLPWYTPWRVVAIGSLKTIVESTLGTDVAPPAVKMDASFVKPGISSWSWVLLKDSKTIFSVQKQFIDYAADMHWQYCLVDALWDTQIGYEKMKELADYAKIKNVGLILWYNSSGSWNTTPQTPKNRLLSYESRIKEFTLLKAMGIKGIKADFFGGDGQSVLQYYIDILRDAADYGIMVNYHGSTLPRGLERTYPNLVSMEAIKGMEFRTFDQANENAAPMHCAMIPFTRNVFDPMDYTPMALYKMPGINRSTTSAFELALSVLFQSGVQHLAETPEGMSHVPAYVKGFLTNLPAQWDDIKFIDGYPGKLAVLARSSGGKWYVSGINGENISKDLLLDLSFLKNFKTGKLITDGSETLSFAQSGISASTKTAVSLRPYGGFVMVFEK